MEKRTNANVYLCITWEHEWVSSWEWAAGSVPLQPFKTHMVTMIAKIHVCCIILLESPRRQCGVFWMKHRWDTMQNYHTIVDMRRIRTDTMIGRRATVAGLRLMRCFI